jgi:CRISPR-associated protein Csm3
MTTVPTSIIRLLGRLIIRGHLRAETGLHIGGATASLAIGAVDNPIIRDPRTRLPYIPGSSLKGRMRSLAERHRGFDPLNPNQTQQIGSIRIHSCKNSNDYQACPVCPLFGVPGDTAHSTPTRLTVRDLRLEPASLVDAQTDLYYAEIKWENAIDRVTSAALPRQIERVPAGAVFGPLELVLSFYQVGTALEREVARVRDLILAMQLLEDDALGAYGSRGSGQVRFTDLKLVLRRGSTTIPFATDDQPDEPISHDLAQLVHNQGDIEEWISTKLLAGQTLP